MNVWIFNQYATDPYAAGSTRHFDCARQLVRRGWDVTIISGMRARGSGEGSKVLGSNSHAIQVIDGVRFLRIRTNSYQGNDLRRAINILQYSVRAFRVAAGVLAHGTIPKPDVVVGSSVHPLAAVVAQAIAGKAGVGFVLELRDLWPQSLIDIGALRPRHPLALALRLLERWLVRRADRVIVLCDKAKEYLVQRGSPPERIAIIPNGVDLERFGESVPPDYADDRFVALYLGAHGVANRLDILLDAARILKRDGVDGIRMEFVGSGPERNRLRQKAQRLGLANVVFRNRVPKQDVPGVLSQADVLLLAEANNTFGSSNKLGDYLAAGRPIIFSTFAPHNIIEECGIAVAPHDSEGLAKALIALRAAGGAGREAIGLRARRGAEEKKSWARLAVPYAQVLEEAHDDGRCR